MVPEPIRASLIVILTSLVPLACCPPGEKEGKCGLSGQCVECNSGADCAGMCTTLGECIPEADVCQQFIRCMGAGSVECADDERCQWGYCRKACDSDSDCSYSENCGQGVCMDLRCTSDGVCPEGSKPVKGSLSCTRRP